MTNRARYGVGLLLSGLWLWWAYGWAVDLAVVSPVHWPLLLPDLVLQMIPAALVAGTAVACLRNRPVASARLAVLAVITALQSLLVSLAAPDLPGGHLVTVEESRGTWGWSPPLPSSTPTP